MLIVDAHQDLAYNMRTFGRDYTRSAGEIRRSEQGSQAPSITGDTLLGWPEYQRGEVAVIFSTLFAAPAFRKLGPWDTQSYETPDQAHTIYRAQLDEYLRLTDQAGDKFCLIYTRSDLQGVLDAWEHDPTREEPASGNAEMEAAPGHPVGLVVLMEGAEGVRQPGELEEWWQLGLRIIGPAWAGTRFCGGTRQPGPLTEAGYALLEAMAGVGFALDLSHMDEKAVLQALDIYPGTIIASHSNAMNLLKGFESNRHLSDRVIRGIIERDGVIGVVPLNHFLLPGWKSGDSRSLVSLQRLVAHIDYICQMAGDAQHVGLGTDFDGGIGVQSTPVEIDTIADLQKLVPLLAERGYSESDRAALLGGNWLASLERVLPVSV